MVSTPTSLHIPEIASATSRRIPLWSALANRGISNRTPLEFLVFPDASRYASAAATSYGNSHLLCHSGAQLQKTLMCAGEPSPPSTASLIRSLSIARARPFRTFQASSTSAESIGLPTHWTSLMYTAAVSRGSPVITWCDSQRLPEKTIESMKPRPVVPVPKPPLTKEGSARRLISAASTSPVSIRAALVASSATSRNVNVEISGFTNQWS